MLALQITSMKQFMNSLLAQDTFDLFLLEEATVVGACTYQIDGSTHKEFYGDDAPGSYPTGDYDFVTWKSMRTLIFDLIKGKHTPLSFKLVLHLMPEHVASILSAGGCVVTPDQVKAFVLTIRYDGTKTMLTTGTAFHTFIMDKEPDILWDNALLKYLNKKEIACETL